MAAEANELTEHALQLRPSLQVELRLPGDLSAVEAECIASFVRALLLSGPRLFWLPNEDFSDWEK
jgi:hypothetical protein